MIKWLESQYGKMHISRGKVYDYIGMDLDYSVPGKVSVRMDKSLANTIEEFLEDTTALEVMPAADHLFDVSTTATRLEETEGREFHRAKARLLFLCKISRPDVHPEVALLTKRVSEPTDEYWKNLARVLAYLKGTPE